MKVLVLGAAIPFARERIAGLSAILVEQLVRAGMEAEALWLPFTPEPADRLIDEMLIARNLRVLNTDRIVALGFPAYLVPTGERVIWVTDRQDLGGRQLAEPLRGVVRAAERQAFGAARQVFVAGPDLAELLRRDYRHEAAMLTLPASGQETAWPETLDRLLA